MGKVTAIEIAIDDIEQHSYCYGGYCQCSSGTAHPQRENIGFLHVVDHPKSQEYQWEYVGGIFTESKEDGKGDQGR